MIKYMFSLAIIFSGSLCAAQIQGNVIRVLDGDTLEILQDKKTVRVRLANIDAPEKKQPFGRWSLMNPLMILVKIIKLRWIHILSYDQMVSPKINNQTTRCANSIFYTTLFTNSAPNYT